MSPLLEIDRYDPQSTASEYESGPSDAWPGLVNVFQEHAFEMGYSRGVNDVLAAFLEATEEFARRRPSTACETRRLLHAFSRHLEERVRRTEPVPQSRFTGGLGI